MHKKFIPTSHPLPPQGPTHSPESTSFEIDFFNIKTTSVHGMSMPENLKFKFSGVEVDFGAFKRVSKFNRYKSEIFETPLKAPKSTSTPENLVLEFSDVLIPFTDVSIKKKSIFGMEEGWVLEGLRRGGYKDELFRYQISI